MISYREGSSLVLKPMYGGQIIEGEKVGSFILGSTIFNHYLYGIGYLRQSYGKLQLATALVNNGEYAVNYNRVTRIQKR